MPQTVNVNFKLDAEVKKNMEQACADMGLSMSAAFTVFAKKVGRERRIPFEISAYSEVPNEVTRAAMNEVRELKRNPHKKTYGSFAELLGDMDE